MSDDPLMLVADRVLAQASADGLGSLSEPDALFFLAWSYAIELDNGGHEQFFFNSAGEYTPETIDSLNQLGLTQQADLLGEAARLLFADKVPRDLFERNAMLDQLGDGGPHEEQLEDLDDRFFQLGGGKAVYRMLAQRYVS